jgi:hypothetical protein
MIGRGCFTTLSLAAALTLSACGGADSGGSSAAPTPTATPAATANVSQKKAGHVRQSTNFPAKFEARVDRKCKAAEGSIRSIAITHYSAERMRKLRDVVEELATDFEQTNAPAKNKRAWRQYTLAVREQADWVGKVEAEVAEGDLAGFVDLSARAKGMDKRLNALSSRYGFDDCADD